MSKLSKFLGSPQEFEIQGEKIVLHPLTVKDLELFMGKENASPEEQMKMSIELIKKSLNDPEVTNEEIEKMNTESFMDIMDAINKLNGFKDERIEKIRERQKLNIR